MVKNPSTVGIAPGEGLIARFGEVVIYLGGETAATERILGAIEAVANGDHPGAAIVQRLAAVIFVGGSEPPPFGLVAPTSDGTVILLRGPLIAEIQGAEGTRRLSGARAFTWVDEIVREPVRRISVAGNIEMPVHPRSNLRDGIVPGGGFELRVGLRRAGKRPPQRTVAKPQAAEPAQTMPAGFDALDEPTVPDRSETSGQPRATGPGQSEASGQGRSATTAGNPTETSGPGRAPATAANRTEISGPGRSPATEANRTETSGPNRSPAAGSGRVETSGAGRSPSGGKPAQPRRVTDVAGSEGPTAKATGGRAEPASTEAMPQAWSQVPDSDPVVLQKDPTPEGPRPPATPPDSRGSHTGALVFEDTVFPLDRAYVIGRSPSADDSVRTAAAAPLQVPRDRHVSRVHAYVTPERGKVFVRDASTPAGTFIAAPGAEKWTRIGTSATELPPGWSIRIGERVVTYRPGERRSAVPKILQKRR
ncbi:FHA domain-containing protein [Nocardia sp. XZ_19_385]|uniref:FHA domain-containing protein n=1 Tax=Nocardia sp. XZ_19_385 TaxID=2769488 RepID=UPI00188FDCFD|nr:FHA domain-containing protein [Nocardia sp. XZ_19_385]